jgi:hypothetical protein
VPAAAAQGSHRALTLSSRFRFFGLGREPIVEAQHENAVFMLLSQQTMAPKIFASSSEMPDLADPLVPWRIEQVSSTFLHFLLVSIFAMLIFIHSPTVCIQFIPGRHFDEHERATPAAMGMVVASMQRMHRVDLQAAAAAGSSEPLSCCFPFTSFGQGCRTPTACS